MVGIISLVPNFRGSDGVEDYDDYKIREGRVLTFVRPGGKVISVVLDVIQVMDLQCTDLSVFTF